MTQDNARKSIIIFLAVSLFCIGGFCWMLHSKGQIISQSERVIQSSQAIINKSYETLGLVHSLLSFQRGYLLSNNKVHLDEYDANKAVLADRLAELQSLTDKIPSQKSRMTELQHHYLGYMEALDQMVQRYRADRNLGQKSDLEKINEAYRSINRVITAVLSEEHATYAEAARVAKKAQKGMYSKTAIGFTVTLILLVSLNTYLMWLRGQQQVEVESRRDTDERLRLAIRGTNDGIYDWNLKLSTLYWSPQFKAMLGYEEDEMEASRETMDRLAHPADRDAVWQTLHKYIHRELPELLCTFRMMHKNGRWIWINMRGKAIFDEDGNAIRLSGTYSDVSAIKEYESRLEEAKDLAEKANAAKTEFLAHMSHEIRTPLTSISGVAEILQNQGAGFSEKQKNLIKVLGFSTLSLKEIINDILDFSKIESGQMELERKVFLLNDLFDQVSSIMSVRAQERGLKFSFDYKNVDGVSIVGDKLRLRQILMNLTGNAIKFTHEGSVKAHATREDYEGQPILKLTVSDTGIGIDNKNFQAVFERFRQADASVSRKYGGTGLGLPISKSLVESMGGQIKLDSELEKGSVFTVILPMELASGVSGSLSSASQNQALPQPRSLAKDRARLLLVEDYEGNIAVISYILESMKCDYDIARTGLEALNLWKQYQHDLILMDVQMPEMDGLTATRQIRTMEHEQGLPHTPIIGMTAHAFVEDKDKCTDAGMDSYLAKPIAENDLMDEIRKYLESAEAHRGDRQAS